MKFSANNFLTVAKSIVAGGGRNPSGSIRNDAGFLVDIPIPLGSLDLRTVINYDGSEAGAAVATLSGAWLTSDETNGRVVKVEESIDTIGNITFPVPRDYDEETDALFVRVLASQILVSTDNDVQLDSTVYIKTAGSALGADLNPTAPGTVLSATEKWLEFDLSQNGLNRNDVVNFVLITNGANDTNGEEVLIHAVEVGYRSCLVSYNPETAAKVALR